jgi:cobalt-zinc-cadmium efflux system outer membrane protein
MLAQRLLVLLVGPVGSALACAPLAEGSAAELSREVLLARVAQCHPDVRAADRTLAAAQADTTTAAQRPNPQLTLGAASLSRDLGRGPLWDKTFDHQVRVDQLIERGDKPALRQAVAQSLRDAARADRAEALRQARLATLRTYYDLSAALARRAELVSTAALYDESLRAFERRLAVGDVAPLDATRFRLDALRLQADLKQAESDVRALRVQLAAAIGAESQAERLTPTRPTSAPPAPATPADNERRPDVVAAQMRVTAAQSARALARAQKTHDVSVGLQVDRYPVSATNTSGSGNTVSVFVSVPLFVRHTFEGENARAEADLNTAEETLRRVRLVAQADRERTLAQWQAAQTRYRLAADELLPAAERVAAGAELAFRRGASSVLDVLDARRSLRAAHIERITAEADLAKAAAEMDGATQTLDALVSP